jgi:hypothetical protein
VVSAFFIGRCYSELNHHHPHIIKFCLNLIITIKSIKQKCYENYIFPLTYEYKYDKKVTGSILNTNSSSSYTTITGSIDSNNNDDVDKIIDWLSNNNKAIDDQLLVHKAILFR